MPQALFDPSRIGPGLTLVSLSLWIFLAIVVVASLWFAFAQKRETEKTIRLAIERGMQLDPALIDRLVTKKSGKPEDYLVGGIICFAVGIGLPILGYFVGRIAPIAFFPIVGSGILVGLIGIGLIVCSVLIDRREKVRKRGSAGCEPL